jgi:hypothetical protein
MGCSVRFSPFLSPNRACGLRRTRLSIEFLSLTITMGSVVAFQAQSFQVFDAV